MDAGQRGGGLSRRMRTVPRAMPSTPGPPVHLRNADAARDAHRQERQDRGAGRELGGQETERAIADRGQQEGSCVLHRPRLRRAERPPGTGLLRRVPYSAEGADEAGGEAGQPSATASRFRPMARRSTWPTPTSTMFGPTTSIAMAMLPTSASGRPEIDGVPGGMTVDETGQPVVAAKGIDIYSPDGKRIHTDRDARLGVRPAPSGRSI